MSGAWPAADGTSIRRAALAQVGAHSKKPATATTAATLRPTFTGA